VALVDVDPNTYTLDPQRGEEAIIPGKTRAIMAVHLFGQPADMTALRDIAKRHSLVLLEDAAQAHGAIHELGRAGAIGDAAGFSFQAQKNLTSGEGGAITTNDPELYRLLRILRNHGLEREAGRLVNPAQGMEDDAANPWYYEQQRPGFNYRLTDLQAALGLSQLGRIGAFLTRRRELAQFYDTSLAGLATVRPLQAKSDARQRSAHHLYVVDIDFAQLGKSRRTVMNELRERGVGTQVHYIPLYRQPFHRGLGQPKDFSSAERYYNGCLSLPLHAALTDADAARVVSAVREVFSC